MINVGKFEKTEDFFFFEIYLFSPIFQKTGLFLWN